MYTHEAHPDDTFPSPLKGPLALAEPLPAHTSLDERQAVAAKAKAFLEFKMAQPIEMVVGGMDDALEAAYESRPFRLYLINIDDSTPRVLFRTSLAPFNMGSKFQELRSFVCLYRAGALGHDNLVQALRSLHA